MLCKLAFSVWYCLSISWQLLLLVWCQYHHHLARPSLLCTKKTLYIAIDDCVLLSLKTVLFTYLMSSQAASAASLDMHLHYIQDILQDISQSIWRQTKPEHLTQIRAYTHVYMWISTFAPICIHTYTHIYLSRCISNGLWWKCAETIKLLILYVLGMYNSSSSIINWFWNPGYWLIVLSGVIVYAVQEICILPQDK